MGSGRRGSTQANVKLDRDVHAVVRKLLDEQEDPLNQPTVTYIYDQIQRSNSHLSRLKKALLLPSIERILDRMKEEAANDDSDDLGSIDGEFDGIELSEPRSVNDMNRQIVRAWKTDPPKSTNDASKDGELEVPKKQKRPAATEPPAKKRKLASEIDRSPPTHVSLSNMAGIGDIIRQFENLLLYPLFRADQCIKLGVQPTRGILLHGPPGCGKTMIANAVAAEFGVPFIAISAPSIVSGMSGESEKALREHFEEATKIAPCILFIDEIDAITPKRESAQREMEKRIVAQLLTCMDDLSLERTNGKSVIVLAATNRPDSLDPALRRGGRFDKEINVPVPSEPAREKILRALTRKMALSGDVDLKKLARRTPGFVGADLNDLVSTAGLTAMQRETEAAKMEATAMDIDEDPSIDPDVHAFRRIVKHFRDQKAKQEVTGAAEFDTLINDADFMTALPTIQPSAKREGFATIPDTTWEDIGALQGVRESLLETIVYPIQDPEGFERLGLVTPSGVLLWGPPGCGKTLLAKAVANESKANFISVKGPELLNKYVGESERAVRQVFQRARSSVPCIIFIDEMDALSPRREENLSESSSRVVNTLLAELDGMSSRKGVYVIGATNRPDAIDPAMLRPGRLSTPLFVGLPGPNDRVEITKTLARGTGLEDSEELAEAARGCDGFSGADLGNLVDQARREAYRRAKGNEAVSLADFHAAREKIKPSVGDIRHYEQLKQDFVNTR